MIPFGMLQIFDGLSVLFQSQEIPYSLDIFNSGVSYNSCGRTM